MTNLKNRNYLNDNIDFWSSNKVYPQAIVVIDINSLKTLNDKYGHEYGDMAIMIIAKAIMKYSSEDAIPIRMGGDEFLIIENMLSDEEIKRNISFSV